MLTPCSDISRTVMCKQTAPSFSDHEMNQYMEYPAGISKNRKTGTQPGKSFFHYGVRLSAKRPNTSKEKFPGLGPGFPSVIHFLLLPLPLPMSPHIHRSLHP